MKRRKAIKSMALSAIGTHVWTHSSLANKAVEQKIKKQGQASVYSSRWFNLPDSTWIGEEFWANRLQDWEIEDGKLKCNINSNNRSAHLLTYQLSAEGNFAQNSIHLDINSKILDQKGKVGFLWGVKGKFKDYRSACITGNGIEACIDTEGYLVLGGSKSNKVVERNFLEDGVELKLFFSSDGSGLQADLSVWHNGRSVVTLRKEDFSIGDIEGNIVLYSDFENTEDETWTVKFSSWDLRGDMLTGSGDQSFGPIYFTQYTQEAGILKMTAQLAPVDQDDLKAVLSVKTGEEDWRPVAESNIHPRARTAHFRVEDWDGTQVYDYKVNILIRLKDGTEIPYEYSGVIDAEPIDKTEIKALALSCNGDMGFPDTELRNNALTHHADVVFFLGDQFYERNAGFGVQMGPPEKSILDFLRKWYLFGWAHRDLFRNRPSICLPDDHDVYHGNIWGEGGKATIKDGGAAARQDTGGYKMPADWVNIVQITQTSHMPDAYDPTPVKQGISVYYTSWKYGGMDFALIEDRKFKSAPKNIFPEEADVYNGYAQNQEFDFASFTEPEKAELIGDRQQSFLTDWAEDWTGNIHMKVLLSATSFMTLQTLPKGTPNDQITPRLPIPERDEYVEGDYFTRDMDSNGWPQARRDEVVRIIRKCYATHIVGDQHLASVAQYGVEDFGDSNFTFTVPAIASVWPRRWWPPVSQHHRPIPGRKLYSGNFKDGFGNKMTVYAAANPEKSNREPAILYDRATGYGVVTFNKNNRRIRFECWPRFMDPVREPQGQYDDWPIEISQYDNFASSSKFKLPTLTIHGVEDPVIKIFDESGELVSAIRIKGKVFQPPVLMEGNYIVEVGDPDANKWEKLKLSTSRPGETVTVVV